MINVAANGGQFQTAFAADVRRAEPFVNLREGRRGRGRGFFHALVNTLVEQRHAGGGELNARRALGEQPVR